MSEFEVPVGSLEELAIKRKERLKNLKRKIQGKEQPNRVEETQGADQLPSDEQKTESNESQDDDQQETVVELKNDDVVTKMDKQIESLKTPLVVEEIDIQNLAPRKPDWDLKRDVSKKLEILERKTQRAIAELIRERLQSNQGNIDLQAVNAVGYTSQSKESKIVR